MERWYLSHPYSDNTQKRLEEVLKIRKAFYQDKKHDNIVLVIPQLATIHLQNDFGRERGMKDCIELLSTCSKMVYVIKEYDFATGMKIESEYCNKNNIPIKKLDLDWQNQTLTNKIKLI
ncbi:MAG: hypothetical protein JSW73_01750 [Candidatus Woesearchaeota archaeon]|nr:MAG: hypothetical protein JSW73_01750 [Candidatus Woesearchaeota archaeon]